MVLCFVANMVDKDSFNSNTWGIRSKIWLTLENRPIIGEGRMAILEAIHQHGSILQAAKTTGVSYRKVRGAIRDMEKAVGQTLVQSYRGGHQGGGAALTPAAHELVKRYQNISRGFQEALDNRFEEVFR